MPRSFLPRTDGGILAWSLNFTEVLSTSWGDYGVSEQAAAQYAALHEAYAAAYAPVTNPGTRSKSLVHQKNAARAELLAAARLLVSQVRGQPDLSDGRKIALGLTVSAGRRGAIPPPAEPPLVSVVSTSGRMVRVRLRGTVAGRRGKPDGVAWATVYAHAGPDGPADPAAWRIATNTARPVVDVWFGDDVPLFSEVQMCARWFNRRGQPGPVSRAARVCLGAVVPVDLPALAA